MSSVSLKVRPVRATAGMVTGAVLASMLVPAPVGAHGHPRPEPEPRAAAVSGPVTRDAWVVVPGVDSDRDGRADRVHVRYLLPRDRPARVPVVVEPSPYWGGGNPLRFHDVDVPLHVPGDRRQIAAAQGRGSSFWSAYRGLLMPRGYAYVFAESLGTGRSTGCPTSGGPNETAAMVAVVRWLTGHGRAVDADGRRVRARWSTGRVGMIGVSYNATLANAAASTGVRGLRAIVPVAGISSWYDYYRSQGAVRAPGGYQGEDADVLARSVLSRSDRRVCRDVVRGIARGQDRRTGDVNSFWRRRDYRRDLHANGNQVKAAVLSLHGLRDFNVMSDHTGRWLRALQRAGVPHQAWWHPDGHGDWLIHGRDRAWRRQVVSWFDRWLKGRRNGVMAEPGSVVAGPRGYWTHPKWPAPSSAPVRLKPAGHALHSGRLGLQPSPSRTMRLVDDADYSLIELARSGPARHRLRWRTAPLERAVVLSGLGSVRVRARFGAPASNLSVGLVAIGPRGTRLISEGWMDPQNARSLASGRALRPGRDYRLTVALDQVLQHRIPRGQRLALAITASDHRFTLRPPPGTRVGVRLDGTWLQLPVVGGRAAMVAALR